MKYSHTKKRCCQNCKFRKNFICAEDPSCPINLKPILESVKKLWKYPTLLRVGGECKNFQCKYN